MPLLSSAFLDVPTFHHQVPPRPPRRERSQRRKWELWARILSGNFAEMTTYAPFRDFLHAAKIRHGTDGFTSLPKEGVLRISGVPRKKSPVTPLGFFFLYKKHIGLCKMSSSRGKRNLKKNIVTPSGSRLRMQ